MRQVKGKENGGVTTKERNRRKLNNTRKDKRRERIMKMKNRECKEMEGEEGIANNKRKRIFNLKQK